MIEDQVVHEVHETRKRIFDECGNDGERFIEYLHMADAKADLRRVTPEELLANQIDEIDGLMIQS